MKIKYIAIPMGISITPKNIDNLLIHLFAFFSIHFFQIHLVAKKSPATICAHVAVTPGFVANALAKELKKPSLLEVFVVNSIKPSGFNPIRKYHITIGPK